MCFRKFRGRRTVVILIAVAVGARPRVTDNGVWRTRPTDDYWRSNGSAVKVNGDDDEKAVRDRCFCLFLFLTLLRRLCREHARSGGNGLSSTARRNIHQQQWCDHVIQHASVVEVILREISRPGLKSRISILVFFFFGESFVK